MEDTFLSDGWEVYSDVVDALVVGDSVELDVVGARAAGMDVVLLDRAGRHYSHEPRVRSLSQLPELLELRRRAVATRSKP
jgi:FMN phosphatase YigB (HAD superfamily)